MRVKEIMTPNPEYLMQSSTIEEAAKRMEKLGTGFLPIGDKKTDKLIGTLTDRDIVVSGISHKKDLSTPVKNIMHKGVYYCYENDDVKEASRKMKKKRVRRLVVLNENKRLAGIVSLGDIAFRCHDDELTGDTLEEIAKH